MTFSFILESTLFSYAQIFFSNRKWFGSLILISTFIKPDSGLVILGSVLFTNLIAYTLQFDKAKINLGFFGFNGLLFGAALTFFYEINFSFIILLVLFLIVTFFITTAIENYFAVGFNLPGLSLPFVLSIYLFFIFNQNLNLLSTRAGFLANSSILEFLPESFLLFFKALGLLLLQSDIFSGIIIFAAILIFSRIMAVLSILGFSFGLIFVSFLPQHLIYDLTLPILFNSIITAIALGCSLIIPSNKSILSVLFGSLFIVIFSMIFSNLISLIKLPILVLPFNFAVLLLIYGLKFREKFGDIILLYFKPGAPEENYYYHQNKAARFERYKFVNVDLPFHGEWMVSQAIDGKYTHKDNWKYAFDFVVVDDKKKIFRGNGHSLKQYYSYGSPVLAPLKGKVTRIIEDIEDNDIGEFNLEQNWGNTVIIDHGKNLFSAVSHLKNKSIRVKEGDELDSGDIIGACGNSGRSPEPHIHFQFQLSDKLGANTFKFPFGHYLSRKENGFVLRSAEFPNEGDLIQNLEINKILKTAFDLKLGDKFKFKYQQSGKEKTEEWEIKIDLLNTFFIESSNNATATFYNDGEVFYFTSYIGKNNTVLYHFYLAAIQVPFCSKQNLTWEDSFPLFLIAGYPLRIITDLLILLHNPLRTKGEFTITELLNNENISHKISNKITLYGKGIFNFITSNKFYELNIAGKGKVHSIKLTENDKQKFYAELIEGD
jgi:urea transporter/murein DD-endopeptidase MepM/ murein hydrolase activator NlpD